MSKKDYQAIARAIHETSEQILSTTTAEFALTILRNKLADVLAAGNPRFDRARFLEACETGRCKGMRS